ncbi:MAG: Ig-like domain-containing protein [Actinobacteria bacterium]|nr:Ig-like domain-containing protein [Actinomycetota bacterium]
MYSAISQLRVSNKALLASVFAATVLLFTAFTGTSHAFLYEPCLTLTPETANNPLNTSHTVTATVKSTRLGTPGQPWGPQEVDSGLDCDSEGLQPIPDYPVTFLITSGPNAGQTAVVNTDANGQATFTWVGAVAGTDTVTATVTDIWDKWIGYQDASGVDCLIEKTGWHFVDGHWVYGDYKVENPEADQETCHDVYTHIEVEVSDTATKNWIPPETTPPTGEPTVTPSAVPSVSIALSKKCQTTKFKVRATTRNGTVTKYTLRIDRGRTRTYRSSSSTKSFTINSKKYKPGTHRFTLTTYFADGSKVVKTGKFKRCAIRSAARTVDPNFTG